MAKAPRPTHQHTNTPADVWRARHTVRMSYFHSRAPLLLLKKAAEAARKPAQAVGVARTWAWRALMFKWLQRLRWWCMWMWWCSNVCGARPPLVPHATWSPKCIIDLISHQNGVSAAAAENRGQEQKPAAKVQFAVRNLCGRCSLELAGAGLKDSKVPTAAALPQHTSQALSQRFHTGRKVGLWFREFGMLASAELNKLRIMGKSVKSINYFGIWRF